MKVKAKYANQDIKTKDKFECANCNKRLTMNNATLMADEADSDGTVMQVSLICKECLEKVQQEFR